MTRSGGRRMAATSRRLRNLHWWPRHLAVLLFPQASKYFSSFRIFLIRTLTPLPLLTEGASSLAPNLQSVQRKINPTFDLLSTLTELISGLQSQQTLCPIQEILHLHEPRVHVVLQALYDYDLVVASLGGVDTAVGSDGCRERLCCGYRWVQGQHWRTEEVYKIITSLQGVISLSKVILPAVWTTFKIMMKIKLLMS